MLEELDRIVDEIRSLQTKLVLLIGQPSSGKTALLAELANQRGMKVLNLGAKLGSHLATIPQRQRALQTNVILRELANEYANDHLLLLDNIELLFDQSLSLAPLELLKRHAHNRRVVAVWPGEVVDGRLTYAQVGHPEYQNYGLDGLVPFEIEKKD